MDLDQLNHFSNLDGLEGADPVEPYDLACEGQSGIGIGQGDFGPLEPHNAASYVHSWPGLDNASRNATLPTSRPPMRGTGAKSFSTTVQKSALRTPTHFTQGTHLARFGAPAETRSFRNPLGLRRSVNPTASSRRSASLLIPPTVQRLNALEAKVQAMASDVETFKQFIERWDPETWECLKEMIQELCEENAQEEHLGIATSSRIT